MSAASQRKAYCRRFLWGFATYALFRTEQLKRLSRHVDSAAVKADTLLWRAKKGIDTGLTDPMVFPEPADDSSPFPSLNPLPLAS